LQSPDLIHEITFSTLLFNQKFRGNPIKRAKRRGYLRNVAVALGNTLNSRAIPALEKAAKDSEALIRLHAVWAIRHIQTEEHA